MLSCAQFYSCSVAHPWQVFRATKGLLICNWLLDSYLTKMQLQWNTLFMHGFFFNIIVPKSVSSLTKEKWQ